MVLPAFGPVFSHASILVSFALIVSPTTRSIVGLSTMNFVAILVLVVVTRSTNSASGTSGPPGQRVARLAPSDPQALHLVESSRLRDIGAPALQQPLAAA